MGKQAISVDKRRNIFELFSDYCREASVLILVFGLLDQLQGKTLTTDWCYIAKILGYSAFAFALGCGFEWLRGMKV
jgi:hypothetical protein